MTHSTLELHVVVVGAGLAGLTIAWALKSAGHRVTVLEKCGQLSMGGADIQISPNAVRCLDKIGLLDHIKHLGNPITMMEIGNWHSMELLSRSLLNPRGDYGSMMFRRDDLIQAYYDIASKCGVEIIFGCNVVDVDQTVPYVIDESGKKFSADLIIGCDGIRSTIRGLIFADRDTKPVVTDTACFQSCIPYDVLTKDPETLALWNDHKGVRLQLGDGKYITSWRNDVRKTLFVIFSQRNYAKQLAIDDWTRKGNKEEVLQLYSDFPSAIQTLIRNMDSCEKWRIVDAVEGADWVTDSGKVILAGDAIHAMPPHAAQGYSQGVEDAAALNVFLQNLQDKTGLSKNMKAWANLREPRATTIQTAARAFLDNFTLPDGPSQQTRDEAIRRRVLREVDKESWNQDIPSVDTALLTQDGFARWLFFYDVIEDAIQKRSPVEAKL